MKTRVRSVKRNGVFIYDFAGEQIPVKVTTMGRKSRFEVVGVPSSASLLVYASSRKEAIAKLEVKYEKFRDTLSAEIRNIVEYEIHISLTSVCVDIHSKLSDDFYWVTFRGEKVETSTPGRYSFTRGPGEICIYATVKAIDVVVYRSWIV